MVVGVSDDRRIPREAAVPDLRIEGAWFHIMYNLSRPIRGVQVLVDRLALGLRGEERRWLRVCWASRRSVALPCPTSLIRGVDLRRPHPRCGGRIPTETRPKES